MLSVNIAIIYLGTKCHYLTKIGLTSYAHTLSQNIFGVNLVKLVQLFRRFVPGFRHTDM